MLYTENIFTDRFWKILRDIKLSRIIVTERTVVLTSVQYTENVRACTKMIKTSETKGFNAKEVILMVMSEMEY